MERYLDEKQVAMAYEIKVNTLRCWRNVGKGPRYYRIGRKVRYKPGDIEAFLEADPVETVDSLKLKQQQEG